MENQPDAQYPFPKVKVLLIDDEEDFRHFLTKALRESGCDISSVSSLAEATKLIERNAYHVIITDLYFGAQNMSGDEFLLQNHKSIEEAKKIVITGFDRSRIKRLAQLKTMGVQIIQKGSGEFTETIKQVILEARRTVERGANQQSSEHELVAVALFGETLKLVSLTPDGNYHFLDEAHNLHNILYIAPSETLALQTAIDELESLINDLKAQERDFQVFFERNPDFILNEDYKRAHSHIVLTKDDGDELIPDFVLEPTDQSALSDLLELKLPSAQVFVLKKNRMRYSSAVLEACAQLREYGLFFDEMRNRELIKEKYGLLAFKPKMFVIIGRRGTVNPIDVRKIEGDVPSLHLRTYDDIVNRMKARFDAMKKGRLRS